MNDDDDTFDEDYFKSIRIKKLESFFLNNNSYENLIRCEECLFLSFIQEIKIDNEMIIIYSNCRNNHNKKFDLFNYLYYYRENKITNSFCYYDKKTKFNEDNFLYCSECKIIFCDKCQREHNKEENIKHKIINVNYLDFFCFEHTKSFDNICLECQQNLCSECLNVHNKNHKIINFNDKIFDVNKIDECIAKFEHYKILLNKLVNILNSATKLTKLFPVFNPYRSKFFYLNDLLSNILKVYKYEKKNNNMNFELLYNLLFVINNINILNINIDDFQLIDEKDEIKYFVSEKNNYPLKFNNQLKHQSISFS